MRRKCFYYFTVLLALLYFLDFAGVPLSKGIDGSLVGEVHDFSGKVIRIGEKDDRLDLEVRIDKADGRKISSRENVLLTLYEKPEKPWEILNSSISFRTQLDYPKGQRNPHCFDYRKYLKSRGIGAVAQIKNFQLEEGALTFKDRYARELLRKKYLFSNGLPSETKGLVMGVLFGDTSFLDEDSYEEFRKNGTAHILAVSGLHIGIIYGIYKKIAGKRKNVPALIALAIVLFTYGELSCWSPSVTRAVLMTAMSITAVFKDLRYDMLTSMSAVGLILIGLNPYVIFGAGFQMSFLAISSIAFIKPLIPVRVPEAAAVTAAAYLGLLPYQIYNFNYISFTALLANIPVVFLAGYFVPLAAAAFIAFSLLQEAGFLVGATDAMGKLILYVNNLTSLDGKGGIEVPSPPLWAVLGISILIFFFSSEAYEIMKSRGNRKKNMRIMGGIAAVTLIFHTLCYSPITYDDMVFADVGQGDCVHIRDGRKNVLIDGGGSINYNTGRKTLKPYLLKNGTASVDLAVATHEHMDHLKGLEELSRCFKVKKLMTGVTAGTEIKIGREVLIEAIWPEYIPDEKGQDENSMCSVFMVYCKGYKILITGDLDEEGERKLIEKYKGTDKLSAHVLKIGHHGSSTSTSDEFLDAVNPRAAVIQTGKNNFGHPSPKIIEKCTKKGIMVYRTDYNGAVGFSFEKEGIRCHTMMGN